MLLEGGPRITNLRSPNKRVQVVDVIKNTKAVKHRVDWSRKWYVHIYRNPARAVWVA